MDAPQLYLARDVSSKGHSVGIRILVVEDDAVLALIAAESLAEGGHTVVGPAYDAGSARALAAAEPIDLALVDINLAGADEGLEVARELRERHGIRTLFVSGQVATARMHAGLAIGLLRKPYEIDELLQSVRCAHAIASGDVPAGARPATLDIF